MQVPDEQKRETILKVATELFATRPFHKVLLSDVAAAASVGKGTLYVYFKSKDDLFLGVLFNGFKNLVDCLQERLADDNHEPLTALETVVRELVIYACSQPHLFELMRRVGLAGDESGRWDRKRQELAALIEGVIRRGVASGQFVDPHPELTARFIPGLVRSSLLGASIEVDAPTLITHITHFVRRALGVAEDAK